jgi:alpha-L-arabinofuranosidase
MTSTVFDRLNEEATPVKTRLLKLILRAGVLTAALLAAAATAMSAEASASLKEAYKGDFMIGAALNERQFTEQDANGAALVKRQFNSISPENVMKWERIHPRPGPDGYDFEAADRYVEFGEKNGMFIVGHTLVWHAQTPRWVFQGEGGSEITREELLKRMHDHIHTVVGRYKGRIKTWDVVNEALNDDGSLRRSKWYQIIGEDFIEKAFQYAHEADPDAELRYNDYSIENKPKRKGVIALVKKLQEKKAPISGLGSQAHANLSWPDAELLDSALTEFAELGIPISITELDVVASQRGQRNQSADISQNAQAGGGGMADAADQKLADQYGSLFRVFLKHRKDIKLVTFWGVTDRDSWRSSGKPLLFDAEGKPKKCFETVIQTALEAQGKQPSSSQPVTAVIDAAKTGAPISPYLYGQFVEHGGSLIYDSLWCELLDDRKFFYHVMPKPAEAADTTGRSNSGFGPSRRRNVGPGRWNPIGPADSVITDADKPFVGDHTPLVKLAGSEPRGIRQDGVKLVKDAIYNGRVQLAGDAGATVSVNIVWGEGDSARRSVPLGKLDKDYKPFTFSFKAGDTGAAQIEISGVGSGSFHVGAVSLMPTDNLDGFRPDAIAALKSLRSGVYRFPGGNFVSAHEWRDAIGDPDKRPPTWDPVWRALQSNDIGTEEFMTMCKLLGVEPYITVNAGTGDAWSAAQYVEYCNGDAGTSMGKLRAANGHPEPYRVKFWGIGNEAWGYSYQYGAMKLNQFEFKHNQFAKAMRKADPTIKLIASGAMPDTMTGSKESLNLGADLIPAYLSPADWTGGLLKNCLENIDIISEHFYNYGNTHFSLAEGRQVPNDPKEPVTDWMRRPANHIRIKYEEYKQYEKLIPDLVNHPKPLNIDEWAYSGRGGGIYPVYPSYAWVFHEMFRHSDIFQMAAYTFATSLLARNESLASLNANGLVFKMYRDHFGVIPAEVGGNSPQPKPADPPGGEQPAVNAGSDTFPVDVAAAWTEDRRILTVAVVNPTDAEQSLALRITGAALSGKGTLWRLASTENNGQNPSVSSAQVESIPDLLTLPRFSASIYELSTRD